MFCSTVVGSKCVQILSTSWNSEQKSINSTYVALGISGSAGEDYLGGRIHLKRDIIGAVVELIVTEDSEGNPRSGGVGHFTPVWPFSS